MIGIIVAEKVEIGKLLKRINAKLIEFNCVEFYISKIDNVNIVIAFSGTGKTNAALTSMNMIINFNVTKIINIGLCGACKLNILPEAILIANGVQYNDVDLTSFGYEQYQIPYEPKIFPIKNIYIKSLQSIFNPSYTGLIVSGDSIITIKNVDSFPILANNNIVGFDMEAASIGHVCNRNNIDFICIKIVSDNLALSKESKYQYDSNLKKIGNKIEDIIIKIVPIINKIK